MVHVVGVPSNYMAIGTSAFTKVVAFEMARPLQRADKAKPYQPARRAPPGALMRSSRE